MITVGSLVQVVLTWCRHWPSWCLRRSSGSEAAKMLGRSFKIETAVVGLHPVLTGSSCKIFQPGQQQGRREIGRACEPRGGTYMSFVYPLFVVLLISTIYATFVGFNLLPQIRAVNSGEDTGQYFYRPSEDELYGVLVSFHLVFGMLITCFILASTSSPGYIPRETFADRKVAGGLEESRDQELLRELFHLLKAEEWGNL
eukprot:1383509-Amorphochlora_amoeboformis.AAC.2